MEINKNIFEKELDKLEELTGFFGNFAKSLETKLSEMEIPNEVKERVKPLFEAFEGGVNADTIVTLENLVKDLQEENNEQRHNKSQTKIFRRR